MVRNQIVARVLHSDFSPGNDPNSGLCGTPYSVVERWHCVTFFFLAFPERPYQIRVTRIDKYFFFIFFFY